MLKNPQASILISSYNKGNYLEQCIKSCLSQTQKNIEVVLLVNHSNDKTNVILKKFSKKIKILKKKRISKFPALNQIDLLTKAFKVSKGSGSNCFIEHPTCNFSMSTDITSKSCFSPMLNISSG